MIVIAVARKPFPTILVDNIVNHGTGGLNIDSCRINPTGERLGGGDEKATSIGKKGEAWNRPWMHRDEDAQRHADSMRKRVEQNSLKGRYPSNVIFEHTSECISVGTGKIKGLAQTRFEELPIKNPKDTLKTRIESGDIHSHIWGHGAGIGVKGVSYTVGFGDESGMESFQLWNCPEECPVRQLDTQSTNSVREDPGFGDVGGVSRYFKQIQKRGLIVLSLFDGISAGRIALERAGVPVIKYYASEIEPLSIQIAQKNYPDTIQLGSVEQVYGADLPEIDLLIGGSPCQGFSGAGLGKGFADPRSVLFWEYVRILQECRPKWFLLENVKMKTEWVHVISKALGVNPISINSSSVSAQNRVRLYWTNIPNVIKDLEDKKIFLADIIENGVVDRDKSHCIDASYYKGGNWEWYMRKNRRQMVFSDKENLGLAQSLYKPTMTKEDVGKVKARLLTPLECERLQTLPEGYTEGLAKTPRYKMIGNSWTVDVIVHILKNLKECK